MDGTLIAAGVLALVLLLVVLLLMQLNRRAVRYRETELYPDMGSAGTRAAFFEAETPSTAVAEPPLRTEDDAEPKLDSRFPDEPPADQLAAPIAASASAEKSQGTEAVTSETGIDVSKSGTASGKAGRREPQRSSGTAEDDRRPAPFRPLPPMASGNPAVALVQSLMEGQGELTDEEIKRLELYRPQKILEAVAEQDAELEGKKQERKRARLSKIRSYAEALEPAGGDAETADDWWRAAEPVAAPVVAVSTDAGETSEPAPSDHDASEGVAPNRDEDLAVEGEEDTFEEDTVEVEPADETAEEQPGEPETVEEIGYAPEEIAGEYGLDLDDGTEPDTDTAGETSMDQVSAEGETWVPGAPLDRPSNEVEADEYESDWETWDDDYVEEQIPVVEAVEEPEELEAAPQTPETVEVELPEPDAEAVEIAAAEPEALEVELEPTAAEAVEVAPATEDEDVASSLAAMDIDVTTAEDLLELPPRERIDALSFLEPPELARTLLASGDADVKKAVVDTLEHEGSPDALNALSACFEETDPQIQLYALEASERLLAKLQNS